MLLLLRFLELDVECSVLWWLPRLLSEERAVEFQAFRVVDVLEDAVLKTRSVRRYHGQ